MISSSDFARLVENVARSGITGAEVVNAIELSAKPMAPSPESSNAGSVRSTGIRCYGLYRGGERRADVVVLSSGRCVVAWPTSVVVYDTEAAARAVHIDHMDGRGEATAFRLESFTSGGTRDDFQTLGRMTETGVDLSGPRCPLCGCFFQSEGHAFGCRHYQSKQYGEPLRKG